jgi:N-acetylmuramoyl-L-alanine amidase
LLAAGASDRNARSDGHLRWIHRLGLDKRDHERDGHRSDNDSDERLLNRPTNNGVGPCVNRRAAIGNAVHADAVIAIHADGGPPGGRGFQVIYPPDVGDTAPIYAASLRLAHNIHASLVASRLLPPSTYVGTNGYSLRSDLAGLNLSTRPAIFVELGNMNNPVEARLQTQSSFREDLAHTLAEGLAHFLTRA